MAGGSAGLKSGLLPKGALLQVGSAQPDQGAGGGLALSVAQ
jgi:hypothetical protein